MTLLPPAVSVFHKHISWFLIDEPDDEEEEEDLEVEGHPTIAELVGMAAGAEIDDSYEWNEFDDEFGDDDFLCGDDPLEMERWQFS